MDASQIQVVSFDCAQTLVDVRWNPPVFAVECAEAVGCAVHREHAALAYGGLLRERWPEFQRLNLSRDLDVCDQFWMDLTRDWLDGLGSPSYADAVIREARRRLYDTREVFEPFQDVVPTLSGLRERGYRLAVLSNWDVSLHRVLAGFELTQWFEVVIASLEEGVEKPHPDLFAILCSRLGVSAGQVLHVGDDVGDDVRGATEAGMQALLIDRSTPDSSPREGEELGRRISRLTDLLDILP